MTTKSSIPISALPADAYSNWLAIGQATASQNDDLALLWGQFRECARRGGRRVGGDAAGS